MSDADQRFLSALQDNRPAAEVNGMVVGMSPQQRLKAAMRLASNDETDNIPEPASYSGFRVGVPNPFGRGLRAFEPNTVIFEGYAAAKAESDQSKIADAAKADGKIQVGATLGKADGQVTKAIAAAMGLAQRAVPYVWGGTSANGVDCSGLLYYAFRSAGIDVPRYRAVDWGRVGQEVTRDQARPGDVIYYDEPGTNTDHVGLYIGNGLMIQAPQSGDHVRVSSIGKPTSIRRVFDDAAFGAVAMPDGSIGSSYNGLLYQPYLRAPITPQAYPNTGSTIYRAPSRTGGTFSARPQ